MQAQVADHERLLKLRNIFVKNLNLDNPTDYDIVKALKFVQGTNGNNDDPNMKAE